MPLVLNGDRIPTLWAEKTASRPKRSVSSTDQWPIAVRIAFVNNMPDSALEDTEMQFFELLDGASGELPVHVTLYSLPNVVRGERGQQHLSNFYRSINELWNDHFDGIIVTGTEPRQSDLRDESYWSVMCDVFDWAAENTSSTVLSCLAAHAGVLHSDRIDRHPLGDKKFGVFGFEKACDHPLTAGTPELIRNPHSRWNEVREDALLACGYVVLTKSADAGVDLFVRKKKKSLFVHFQGHPEYGALTLLKEYRRDIRRFVRQERETYPSMPLGYFDVGTTKLLNEFRETVVASRREELMTGFPDAVIVKTLENSWQSSAKGVYRNWLQYLSSRQTDVPVQNSSNDQGKVHVGR
jgi:homoserine O-succinyltransferase/O-acetyltransferase